MNEFQKDYLLKRQDYGVLYPYVMEETAHRYLGMAVSYGLMTWKGAVSGTGSFI